MPMLLLAQGLDSAGRPQFHARPRPGCLRYCYRKGRFVVVKIITVDIVHIAVTIIVNSIYHFARVNPCDQRVGMRVLDPS